MAYDPALAETYYKFTIIMKDIIDDNPTIRISKWTIFLSFLNSDDGLVTIDQSYADCLNDLETMYYNSDSKSLFNMDESYFLNKQFQTKVNTYFDLFEDKIN